MIIRRDGASLERRVGFLKRKPLFLLLLPFFFVVHGYNENLGFISVSDIALLILGYTGVALVVCLFFFLLFRNLIKASLVTLFIMAFFLFYGALFDFLKIRLPFAARYRVLLPLFLGILLTLFFFIGKSKHAFSGVILFFNLLLCIYVLVDLVTIGGQVIHPPANKFSVYSYLNVNKYPWITHTQRPDIYFLLFDEYASSLSLKENYGFINDLDSFLTGRGFQVQKKGYSNYNYTPASMASILNASYIKGISNNTVLSIDNINYCNGLVKSSQVLKFLTSQGYTIVNHSIFDLPGNPSPVDQLLLPLKTRLITDNTLPERMYKDLGWLSSSLSWVSDSMGYRVPKNNQVLLEMTKKYSAQKSAQPAFVYTHLYMPHDPYFFDRFGRLKSKETIFSEESLKRRPVKPYLEYLLYVNMQIKKLLDTIMANTNGKAVILLMGDHGFREKIDSNLHQNYQAMNAVYLPGRDYHLFYDSISSVNQFRVLFNTLFKQSLPLLKDSTIFLPGKE